jgi:hypothetical protein
MVEAMDRYVIVRADALGDLCALVDRAVEDIRLRHGEADPLAGYLRGAVAEIRTSVVPEPAV